MNFFDRWYRADASSKEGPDEELVELFNEKSEGKVLDIGCGQGRNGLYLASLGYQVIGVDVSKHAIIQLNQNAKILGYDIEGIECDVDEFSFTEEYDIIILSNILQFLLKRVEQIRILHKVMEYTATNGVVFIKVPLAEMQLESLCFKMGMLNRFFTLSEYSWGILQDSIKLSGTKKDFEVNVFIARKS